MRSHYTEADNHRADVLAIRYRADIPALYYCADILALYYRADILALYHRADIPALYPVIPAKAGIHSACTRENGGCGRRWDARERRDVDAP